MSPKNSYAGIVRVFGDGAFKRYLGHKSGAFMNGISALIRRGQAAC